MRSLVEEMSNIGLNYGSAICNNIEENIVIVLLQRYSDINGFVAELLDHCIKNSDMICPETVASTLQTRYKESKNLEVRHATMVWGAICDLVSGEGDGKCPQWRGIADAIQAISSDTEPLQIDKEGSFPVRMRGWDPVFRKFSVFTAKQTRWTSAHHSTRIPQHKESQQ